MDHSNGPSAIAHSREPLRTPVATCAKRLWVSARLASSHCYNGNVASPKLTQRKVTCRRCRFIIQPPALLPTRRQSNKCVGPSSASSNFEAHQNTKHKTIPRQRLLSEGLSLHHVSHSLVCLLRKRDRVCLIKGHGLLDRR